MIEQRKAFHHQLDEVRDDLVVVAAMVIEVLPRGTEALLTGDLNSADEIIRGDDVIDLRSVDLEDRCFHLLALQQPMASDLRAIITAIKLVGEIERSGDLVVNICKAARRLYGATFRRSQASCGLMTQRGRGPAAAPPRPWTPTSRATRPRGRLDDMDDLLDQLHDDFIQAIFESHSSTSATFRPPCSSPSSAASTSGSVTTPVNIAERVHYMVTGGYPTRRAPG